MSTTYLSVDYFPLTVNFFDRDAIELAEAKYGIRVDGAVCKLLCKIFKEGYYIPWGEEQSLIFARKLGGELKGKEIFINTGSTPIIPAIDGIQQSQHVYTSSARFRY